MVQTQPHGSSDVVDHVNPEYDPNEDGKIDGAETDIDMADLNDGVTDEAASFNAVAGSNTSTVVNFGQAYKSGAGSAGMQGVSPLTGDASVVSYSIDGNGNIDGMTIRYENSDVADHTIEWRFAGVPA